MPAEVSATVSTPPKPPPLRELIGLRIQGLTNKAIGERFGVTSQAISKRISGALAFLDGERLDNYRKFKVQILECIEDKLLSELCNPDRMKKATLGNIAYAFEKVHIARRLEAGESTQNLGLHAMVEKFERGKSPPKFERTK
jgi:transcriptional regulator with XRE-family HTH domain